MSYVNAIEEENLVCICMHIQIYSDLYVCMYVCRELEGIRELCAKSTGRRQEFHFFFLGAEPIGGRV
ncbi:hypothetical protein Hanom_Chr16g01487111 [Helianthus anomalus]